MDGHGRIGRRTRARASLLGALALVVAMPSSARGQAGFTAQISPDPVALTAGGSSVAVTVTTTISTSTEPIEYSFTGLPPGISTGGAQLVSPPFDPVTFVFAAGASVPRGTYTGSLVGTTGMGSQTFPVTVVVAQPDFTLLATPASLALAPGESSMVIVMTSGIDGFAGTVSVNGEGPSTLSLQPATFAIPAGGSQAVVVAAAPSAPPGSASLLFTGMAPEIAESRTTTVDVVIRAPAPAIETITPPSVATGTSGNLLLVTGRNFDPGAAVTSASPGVRVTAARILGPGTAEVVVEVRPDAAPGPYRLDLRNPDGGMASGDARLLVYPAGSLAAPLAVTAVQMVTPRPWQIVEPGQRLHAHALLATSGIGTVVLTWLLDGIPFDRSTHMVSSGFPVEVRSAVPIPLSFTGEHRVELAIESPAGLPPQGVPFLQAAESRSALRVLTPPDGDLVDPASAVFRWSLAPGASGYEVEVRESVPDPGANRSEVGVRRRVTTNEWRPEPALLERIGPGVKLMRVRPVFPGEARGDPTPWRSFTLQPADLALRGIREASGDRAVVHLASVAQYSGSGADSEPDADSGSGGELELALQSATAAIASEFDDPPSLTRLLLSGQIDARGSVLDLLATADLAASADLGEPWDVREESRNWIARLGANRAEFRQEATIGFAPPSFLDQTEFLTVVGSGGGAQGTFGSPAGRLSYYRSLNLSGNGSFAGFEPEVDALAYELSEPGGRFLLRTMALRVTDPAVEEFSAGGEGRALGAVGAVDLGLRLALVVEAAAGDFEPGEGSFDEARDGGAFRLSASGAAGTLRYELDMGRTGGGFVNPANRGFTPGGVSGRTHAELSLQRNVGPAYVRGSYRHVRSGAARASGDPGTKENGARLDFSMPLSRRVAIDLRGNLAGQRGDAFEEIGLPGTHRAQKGLELTLSERLGPLVLNQGLTWQELRDHALPSSDQRVTGVNLAASGAVTPFLRVSAAVADTRARSAPEIGTTARALVSLQPSLSFQRLSLDLRPRVAYSRVHNDVWQSEAKTEQYQIVAHWTPRWLGGLLALEMANDWSRSWAESSAVRPPFERELVLTLTFNWSRDHHWPAAGPDAALATRRQLERLRRALAAQRI